MQEIINHIHRLTGRDLSVYADSFLQKSIGQRVIETGSKGEDDYLGLLIAGAEEVDVFLNALNVSYSLFFRNPLDYSIIERYIFPALFHRTKRAGSSSVRVWSAGCADGPEPYSLAMIGDELAQHFYPDRPPLIFATDISAKAIGKARIGAYYPQSIQNVKQYQLESYFTQTDQVYRVSDQLKKQVEFSEYDLLDIKTSSPPSAIFGGFDMVICCNLMVYYKRDIQMVILNKIHRSLGDKGFLMVDPSEKSIVKSFRGFRLYSALGNIFVKN